MRLAFSWFHRSVAKPCGLAVAVAATLASAPARAGMTLVQGKELKLDVGALLHAFVVASGSSTDGGGFQGDARPVLRRARLRVEATLWDRFAVLLQTDRGTGESGSGLAFNLIDAYARLKLLPGLELTAGLHLPPGPRITNEASANLLTIDRPSQAFKSLSWGMRTLAEFDRVTLASSDSGLRTGAPVRDLGATLHGHTSFGPHLHGKYAVGVYEGVPRAFSDAPHLVARIQVNAGESEPGLIQRGNYGGTKRTVAVGAYYAVQPDVARTVDGRGVTYQHVGADAFFEQPAGPGHVTLEVAVQYLNLGGASAVVVPRSTTPADYRRTEGAGVYGQAGLLVGRVQPWIGAETFRASVPEGNFSALRAGANYFLVPRAVSVRAGYELFGAPRSPVPGERTVHSGSLGVYVAF